PQGRPDGRGSRHGSARAGGGQPNGRHQNQSESAERRAGSAGSSRADEEPRRGDRTGGGPGTGPPGPEAASRMAAIKTRARALSDELAAPARREQMRSPAGATGREGVPARVRPGRGRPAEWPPSKPERER